MLRSAGGLGLSLLFASSLTLLLSSPSAAAPPLFPGPVMTAGDFAVYSATADLNADGHLDIVVANQSSDDISVLLGTGEGGFLPEVRLLVGQLPFWLAIADLTSDGVPDIAVASLGSGSVSILIGQGDGSFATGPSVGQVGAPTCLVIADFNGDARPDLAVLDSTAGIVRVFRGNGDGTFGFLSMTVVPGGGYGMTEADFNDDGRADVAVTDYYPSSTFAVLLGTGSGTFSTLGPFPAGSDAEFISSDDFNSDGKPDLVIANGDANSVEVRLGRGDGTFDAPTTAPVGARPYNLVTGDFNEDGHRDIATVNSSRYVTNAGDLSVLLGDGNGGFAPERRMSGFDPYSPFAIVAADIDEDGHLDIAVNDASSQSYLYVYFGDGAGNLESRRRTVLTGQETRGPAMGDINGDGRADLVVPLLGAYPASIDRVAFFLATSSGTYVPAGELAVTAPFHVFVEDLDGDGHNDLLICTSSYSPASPPAISAYRGDGGGGFSLLSYVRSSAGPAVLVDLNGDGAKDIVRTAGAGQPSIPGAVRVHRNLGGGVYDAGVDYQVAPSPYGLTAGDFNGDGVPDIAVATSPSKSTSLQGDLSVLLGNGDGTFQPSARFGSDGGAGFVAAGEFTGDGKTDLVVSYDTAVYQSTAPGALRLFAGDGLGHFTPSTVLVSSGRAFSLVVGDLDNDGFDDVAGVGGLPSGGPSAVLLARSKGDGTLRPVEFFYQHERSLYLSGGDFDRDGRPDLVVGGQTLVEILPNQGPLPGQPLKAVAAAMTPAECTSPAGAVVTLDGTGSNGPGYPAGTLDGIIAFDWYEDFGAPDEAFLGSGETLDVTRSLGSHLITLQVTDRSGESDTDAIVVVVIDKTPPRLDPIVDPYMLWPPNHRMVPVQLGGVAVDVCDPSPTLAFLGVVSSEPDDAPGNGDGHTADDVQVVSENGANVDLLLRAERDANGPGRTYTVAYLASDAAGNTAEVEAVVPVPHDLGGDTDPLLLDVTRRAGTGVSGTVLGWTAPLDAVSYDVLRGPVRGIVGLGSYTTLTDTACVGRAVPIASLSGGIMDEDPAPGAAFYYLVEYFDGRYSGYGTASSGGEIVVANGDWCR